MLMLCKSCGRYMQNKHRCIYCGKRAIIAKPEVEEKPIDSIENENYSCQKSANEVESEVVKPKSKQYFSSCAEMNKRWRSQSKMAKILALTSWLPTLLIFAALGFIIYAGYTGGIIEYFSRFDHADDMEIMNFIINGILRYVAYFIITVIGFSVFTAFFTSLCIFDCGKWMVNNGVDCIALIKCPGSGKYEHLLRYSLAEAYYTATVPGAKTFHYVKLVFDVVFDALFSVALLNFLERMAYGLYQGFEVFNLPDEAVLKMVFLSNYAIFFYVSIFALIIQKSVFVNLTRKRAERFVSSL